MSDLENTKQKLTAEERKIIAKEKKIIADEKRENTRLKKELVMQKYFKEQLIKQEKIMRDMGYKI